jgi:hypothetical protein
MKTDLLQTKLNSVEIHGLEFMFNQFYRDYLGYEESSYDQYEPCNFFYCDDSLNSEDVANGTPLEFEGYKIMELAKRDGGDLTYMILEDENEERFLCEFNMYNGQWYILETELSGKTF